MGKPAAEKATNEEVKPKKRGSPANADADEPLVAKRGRPVRAASKATKDEQVEPSEKKEVKKKATRGKQAEKVAPEEEVPTSTADEEPAKSKPSKRKATKAKPDAAIIEEENKTSSKEMETTKAKSSRKRVNSKQTTPVEEESESLDNESEPTKGKPKKETTKRPRQRTAKTKSEEPLVEEEEESTVNNEVEAPVPKATKKKATKGKPAKSQPISEAEESTDTSEKEVTSTVSKHKDEENKTNATEIASSMKIVSWNVGGIRSVLKKGALTAFIDLDADIICMQEVRCTSADLPPELKELGDAYPYKDYVDSTKKGYAGCATWCKTKPLSVQIGIGDDEMDSEGRVITSEFDDFYLVNVYVPNAGRKLVTLDKRLRWNTLFEKFCSGLDSVKPVVITGDMNVSHKEIDLARPKQNVKNAGFTAEERDGMTHFLALGFIDTYRHFYPETVGYTFWAYMGNARAKNIGWRLDYFFVSKRFLDKVKDSNILSDITGSDHCPVILKL